MNAAANTIATTSTISAALIRRYASTENRGSAVLRLRADRTRTNVIIGVKSEPSFSAHAWVESDGVALLPPGDYGRMVAV